MATTPETNKLPPVWSLNGPESTTFLLSQLRGRKVCFTDVDETLSRTADQFTSIFEARHGVHIPRSEMREYGVEHAVARTLGDGDLQDPMELTFAIFKDPDFYYNIPPHEDVVDAVRILHENGHKVVAVTHRERIEAQRPGITQQWLAENGVPCDGIIFAGPDQKVALLTELRNHVAPGSFFLEDHPDTAQAAIEALGGEGNIRVGLLERPWTVESGIPTITAEDILALAGLTLKP